MQKKKFVKLLTFSLSPILISTILVACSNQYTKKVAKPTPEPLPTPSQPTPITPPKAKSNLLKINNTEIDLQDGNIFFLIKNYYNGEIIDNRDGNPIDGIVQIRPQDKIELKNNDSLIWVFDLTKPTLVNINNYQDYLYLKFPPNSIVPAVANKLMQQNSESWAKTIDSNTKLPTYYLKFAKNQLSQNVFGALRYKDYIVPQNIDQEQLYKNLSGFQYSALNQINSSAANKPYFDDILNFLDLNYTNGTYKKKQKQVTLDSNESDRESNNAASNDKVGSIPNLNKKALLEIYEQLHYLPIVEFGANSFEVTKIADNALKISYKSDKGPSNVSLAIKQGDNFIDIAENIAINPNSNTPKDSKNLIGKY
ncbi:hypothetical protein ACW95P_02325 [Candidatus Mycoplasma pogonae]